ncbi:MAG: Rid family detoxifying hydrolase [bacterium]
MSVIKTDRAPDAVGPYSQGRIAGGRIVTAGQIGLDPETSEMVNDSVKAEARRALRNILAIVEAGGGTPGSIVKTTAYITDLGYYGPINELYEDLFSKPYPARSVIGVDALPKEARVEIEAEAVPAEA